MGCTNYDTAYDTAHGGPAVGTSTPVPVPGATTPASFLAALRVRLLADTPLAGLLTGGLWNDKIPQGRGHPVALTTLIPTGDSPTGAGYIQSGFLQISAYGNDTPTIRIVQDRIAQLISYPTRLTGTAGNLAPQLRWSGGYCMLLRPENPLPQPKPTLGQDGRWIFGEIRQFSYMFAASYTVDPATTVVTPVGGPFFSAYDTAFDTAYGSPY